MQKLKTVMGCYVWKNILVKVNSFKAFDTRTQTDPKRSDDSRVHRLTARDGAPAPRPPPSLRISASV